MSLRVFLATAAVATLTKAEDWACENYSNEEVTEWGEYVTYFSDCTYNENKYY